MRLWTRMNTAIVALSLTFLSAPAAMAQDYSGWRQRWWNWWNARYGGGQGGGSPHSGGSNAVPEIDASAGLLAVAAVLAAMALAWELRRRRAR